MDLFGHVADEEALKVLLQVRNSAGGLPNVGS